MQKAGLWLWLRSYRNENWGKGFSRVVILRGKKRIITQFLGLEQECRVESGGNKLTLMSGIIFTSYTEYPEPLFKINVLWTRLFTQFRIAGTKEQIVPHKEPWLHQV